MRRFLLIAFLLAPLFIFPTTVEACTPPPGGLPRYTVADHVNSAPIVVEGTVTRIIFQPNTPLHAATIQVIRYFKGSGPSTITVDGYGPSSVCLSTVEQGAHLIFYVRANEGGTYRAYYKSQFDATASADSQTIAEVIAAMQNTTPTVTPTITPTRSTTVTPETVIPRATLLTPNATLTAQRAIGFTATAIRAQDATNAAIMEQLLSAGLTQTASAANIPSARVPTPTPASLFSGSMGFEVASLLGLGCLLGGFLGIGIGVIGMYLLTGRKND